MEAYCSELRIRSGSGTSDVEGSANYPSDFRMLLLLHGTFPASLGTSMSEGGPRNRGFPYETIWHWQLMKSGATSV